MTNTPEIQARIERLNREHPPAKGMEWRAVESGPSDKGKVAYFDPFGTGLTIGCVSGWMVSAADAGHYFRQVPAEAKEEGEVIQREAIEGNHMKEKEFLRRLRDVLSPRNADDANHQRMLEVINKRIMHRMLHLTREEEATSVILAGCERRASEAARPAPEPGLDYERLFEVLPEAWGCYSMDESGCVFAHQKKAYISEDEWVDGGAMCRIPEFLLRNLPADWTQSLRVREPKPEPDVEPDENTPRLTEVEFQRDGHSHWLIGHLLELSADKPTRFLVLMDDNRQLWVPRCRLRREGK